MLEESRSPLGSMRDCFHRWSWVWWLLVVVLVALRLWGSSQVGDVALYMQKMLGSGTMQLCHVTQRLWCRWGICARKPLLLEVVFECWLTGYEYMLR